MKKSILLVIILLLTACNAQKKKGMGYADKNFKATNLASNAHYYMIKKYVEPDFLPSFNPTGDGFIKGYGYSLNLTPVMTDLDHYFFEYYNFKDKKVMEAKALVVRSNNDFALYGPAFFYHDNGKVKAKAQFDNTQLCGRYIEYDKNEKYLRHKYYMADKEFVPKIMDKRILGKWKAITKVDGVDYYLYNEIFKDGLMIITTQLVPYKNSFGEEVTGKAFTSEFLWTYKKTGENRGDLVVHKYDGTELGTDEIQFLSNDKFTSVITKHSEKHLIGEKYEFVRE